MELETNMEDREHEISSRRRTADLFGGLDTEGQSTMPTTRRRAFLADPDNTSSTVLLSATAAKCSANSRSTLAVSCSRRTKPRSRISTIPIEVKSVYYPEVERLLKRVAGAERVVIFDHVVRNPVLAERGEKGVRAPAKVVHNDYSLKSAPRRVRDHLPEEADRLLRNRFAEINVWRAIRGPIESSPLALCDARSISAEDIVPADLVYRDRVGETYGFLYNPKHRWYYFPHLQRNEAILLKCYDSTDDGRARFTAHTSFEDPTSPPNAAPRESIEVRSLIFFAPEANDPRKKRSDYLPVSSPRRTLEVSPRSRKHPGHRMISTY